jgi:hypothetical protein
MAYIIKYLQHTILVALKTLILVHIWIVPSACESKSKTLKFIP